MRVSNKARDINMSDVSWTWRYEPSREHDQHIPRCFPASSKLASLTLPLHVTTDNDRVGQFGSAVLGFKVDRMISSLKMHDDVAAAEDPSDVRVVGEHERTKGHFQSTHIHTQESLCLNLRFIMSCLFLPMLWILQGLVYGM